VFLGTFITKRDKSGRIVIPEKIRNGLGNEVDLVWVGCGDHVEIWTQEAWVKEQPRMKKFLDKVHQ